MSVKQIEGALSLEEFRVITSARDQFKFDDKVGWLLLGLLVALALVVQNL